MLFFHPKSSNSFSYFCMQGASDEYPNVLCRNKNSNMRIPPLIWSYTVITLCIGADRPISDAVSRPISDAAELGVCLLYSNILNTTRGSRMGQFKF